MFWQSCQEDSFSSSGGLGIIANQSIWSVDFDIKKGAQAVDLVAATANEKTCPEEIGIAINVTGPNGTGSHRGPKGLDRRRYVRGGGIVFAEPDRQSVPRQDRLDRGFELVGVLGR